MVKNDFSYLIISLLSTFSPLGLGLTALGSGGV